MTSSSLPYFITILSNDGAGDEIRLLVLATDLIVFMSKFLLYKKPLLK